MNTIQGSFNSITYNNGQKQVSSDGTIAYNEDSQTALNMYGDIVLASMNSSVSIEGELLVLPDLSYSCSAYGESNFNQTFDEYGNRTYSASASSNGDTTQAILCRNDLQKVVILKQTYDFNVNHSGSVGQFNSSTDEVINYVRTLSVNRNYNYFLVNKQASTLTPIDNTPSLATFLDFNNVISIGIISIQLPVIEQNYPLNKVGDLLQMLDGHISTNNNNVLHFNSEGNYVSIFDFLQGMKVRLVKPEPGGKYTVGFGFVVSSGSQIINDRQVLTELTLNIEKVNQVNWDYYASQGATVVYSDNGSLNDLFDTIDYRSTYFGWGVYVHQNKQDGIIHMYNNSISFTQTPEVENISWFGNKIYRSRYIYSPDITLNDGSPLNDNYLVSGKKNFVEVFELKEENGVIKVLKGESPIAASIAPLGTMPALGSFNHHNIVYCP